MDGKAQMRAGGGDGGDVAGFVAVTGGAVAVDFQDFAFAGAGDSLAILPSAAVRLVFDHAGKG